MRAEGDVQVITLESFGFGHATPDSQPDAVFDTRRLMDDPAARDATFMVADREVSIREVDGTHEGVQEMVWRNPACRWYVRSIVGLAVDAKEAGLDVLLHVGCWGGRHRSVALVEMAAWELEDRRIPVTVTHHHRDEFAELYKAKIRGIGLAALRDEADAIRTEESHAHRTLERPQEAARILSPARPGRGAAGTVRRRGARARTRRDAARRDPRGRAEQPVLSR